MLSLFKSLNLKFFKFFNLFLAFLRKIYSLKNENGDMRMWRDVFFKDDISNYICKLYIRKYDGKNR